MAVFDYDGGGGVGDHVEGVWKGKIRTLYYLHGCDLSCYKLGRHYMIHFVTIFVTENYIVIIIAPAAERVKLFQTLVTNFHFIHRLFIYDDFWGFLFLYNSHIVATYYIYNWQDKKTYFYHNILSYSRETNMIVIWWRCEKGKCLNTIATGVTFWESNKGIQNHKVKYCNIHIYLLMLPKKASCTVKAIINGCMLT